jgi:hypothetical protein
LESSILVDESDEATAQLLLRALTFAGFDVAIAASGRRGSDLSEPGRTTSPSRSTPPSSWHACGCARV